MKLDGIAQHAKTLVGLQNTSSEEKDSLVSVGRLIEVVTIDRPNEVQWDPGSLVEKRYKNT